MTTPNSKITSASWFTADEPRQIMDALNGADGTTRFVGGVVRDTLMGLPAGDVDIATIHHPDEVIKRLEAAGLKAVPTGIDHGTITAVCNHQGFEITTLRKDVETDGRRAVVAFSTDWTEDAARRDFTINALYADVNGCVYDPVGEGFDDLAHKQVRFIGDPEVRICEDYLRILRFFRFHALFGAGEIDREGLAACTKLAGGIETLSGERLRAEMLKLLAAERPQDVINAMAATGVLAEVLPGKLDLDRLTGMCELPLDRARDAVLRLAALVAEGLPDTIARLRLSNAEEKRIQTSVSEALPLSEHAQKAMLYRLGREVALDQICFGLSKYREYVAIYDVVAQREDPVFPVTGKDLLSKGVGRGPEVGDLLSQLEKIWIGSDFSLTKTGLLDLL